MNNNKNKLNKFLNGINFQNRRVCSKHRSWYDNDEVELDISVIRDINYVTHIKVQIKADKNSESYRAVFYFLSLLPNSTYDVCCDIWLFDAKSKCTLRAGLEKLKINLGYYLVINSKPLDDLITSMVFSEIVNK